MSYVHHNKLDVDHIPKESIGKYLFKILSNQDPNNALNVDAITGEVITSQKCLKDSIKLTYIFKNYGLKKGDRITIISENTLNYCVSILAGLYSGIVVCPINPSYTLSEMKHALSYSKPHLVFCSEEVLPLILQIKDELKYIHNVVLLKQPNNKKINVSCLDEILQSVTDPVDDYKPEDIDYIQDDALILMSSGTTGAPKGVLLNQQSIRYCIGCFSDPNLDGFTFTDVTLQVLPIFHILGLMIQLLAIACSVKVVLLNKFNPDPFMQNIQDHQVTKLFMVPPLVVFLAKTPLTTKYDISSINEIIITGAPISTGVLEEVEEKIKSVKICQLYGITELGGTITMQSRVGLNKVGSVGVITSGVSSKVCDPSSGLVLKPLEMGELCFKSTGMMKGYIGNNGLNQDCFDDDGFYHTGDLGYYDHDNLFFVVDRIKELIKYKGFQVAPAELEDLISQHPAVKECAVVGKPDERAGELPLAFIVKKENSDVTEDEIIKFVAERISVQKQLHGGVKFLCEIPKTSSGKTIKNKLKELAATT